MSTHAQRARRQQRSMLVREVPVAADLLALGLGAGATPVEALEIAARSAPPTVAAALNIAVRRERHGSSLAQALAVVSDAYPELAPLMRALLAAHHGAPVQALLERLSTDARLQFRRRAEARARRVPVQLLFPLVFLVLPAFALLSVIPAVIAGLRSL